MWKSFRTSIRNKNWSGPRSLPRRVRAGERSGSAGTVNETDETLRTEGEIEPGLCRGKAAAAFRGEDLIGFAIKFIDKLYLCWESVF